MIKKAVIVFLIIVILPIILMIMLAIVQKYNPQQNEESIKQSVRIMTQDEVWSYNLDKKCKAIELKLYNDSSSIQELNDENTTMFKLTTTFGDVVKIDYGSAKYIDSIKRLRYNKLKKDIEMLHKLNIPN